MFLQYYHINVDLGMTCGAISLTKLTEGKILLMFQISTAICDKTEYSGGKFVIFPQLH